MDSRGAGRGKGNRGEGEEGGGGTRPEAVIDFERDDGGFPLEVARGLGRGGRAWLCMANGWVFLFSFSFFPGKKRTRWGGIEGLKSVYLFFRFPSLSFLAFVLLGLESRNFPGF